MTPTDQISRHIWHDANAQDECGGKAHLVYALRDLASGRRRMSDVGSSRERGCVTAAASALDVGLTPHTAAGAVRGRAREGYRTDIASWDAVTHTFSRQQIGPVTHPLFLCIAIVVAHTIARCIFVTAIDLRVDEAYYWTWSKENVISYLDHPPLIAWFIRLGTAVFGDTNFGVRFPGLLSVSLMQLLLGDIVRRLLRDRRCVVAVVLMTEASLAYGLGMTKITPDVALIPCELAMLWSLVRLTQSNDKRWWLAAGLFGGFALLARYTAILLLPAVAAFVLVPSWRKEQLSKYPPAEPGALGSGPLEAADGIANAIPVLLTT